jgi:hypothetical protein
VSLSAPAQDKRLVKGDLEQPALDRLLASRVARFDRLGERVLQGFVGQIGISQDACQKEP